MIARLTAAWLSPLVSVTEERRRKWREAKRRHKLGQSMSRREAARLAALIRWERRA